MSDKEIWVLTEEYNEYDQFGDYYRRAFIGKPSADDLMRTSNKIGEKEAKMLLETGGGREGWESNWFNLEKQDEVYW